MKRNDRKRAAEPSGEKPDAVLQKNSSSSRNAIFSSYSSSKRQKMFLESSRKRSSKSFNTDVHPSKKKTAHPLKERCNEAPSERSKRPSPRRGPKKSDASQASKSEPQPLFEFKEGVTARLKRKSLFCSQDRIPKLVKSQEMTYEDITADRCQESMIDDVMFQEEPSAKVSDRDAADEKQAASFLSQTERTSASSKTANLPVAPQKLVRAKSSDDVRSGTKSDKEKNKLASLPSQAFKPAAVISLTTQTTKIVKVPSTAPVASQAKNVPADDVTSKNACSEVPVTASTSSSSSGPFFLGAASTTSSTNLPHSFFTPAVTSAGKPVSSLLLNAASTAASLVSSPQATSSAPATLDGFSLPFKSVFETSSSTDRGNAITTLFPVAKTNAEPTASTTQLPVSQGLSGPALALPSLFGSGAPEPAAASARSGATVASSSGLLSGVLSTPGEKFKFGSIPVAISAASNESAAAKPTTAATAEAGAQTALSSAAFSFKISRPSSSVNSSSSFNFQIATNAETSQTTSLPIAPLMSSGSQSKSLFGSGPAPSFGASQPADPPGAPKFGFGSASTATGPRPFAFGASPAAPAPSGFTFKGTATDTSLPAPAPAFKFGGDSMVQSPTPSKFSFGAASTSSCAFKTDPAKFSFGTASNASSFSGQKASQTGQNPTLQNLLQPNAPSSSLFSFQNAPDSTTPAFGSSFQMPPNPFNQSPAPTPTINFNLGTSGSTTPQRPRARASRLANRRNQRK